MLEVKVEKCAGIDVGKKFLAVCILIGLAKQKPVGEVRRFRHECERVGKATDMATGKRMHGSGHGEYRFVLETGVQYFRGKPEGHFGKSRAGQSVARQEERPER